ncbi:MAG: ABATE domain-containing protein [Edaphobacter sp.]
MIAEPITATFHFPLLGESLSLDLVNTRVRKGGADVDLLDGPSALTAWLAAEAGRQPWAGTATAMDLRVVRAMRDAIAELLVAMRTGMPPRQRALRTVNAALSSSTTAVRLVWTPVGPRAKARAATLERDTLLHALAVDAVTILTGPQAKLLRRCAHPECVLQFLARNPRRRWCSAAVCGNRARVARHYLRQQAHGR